MCWPPVRASDGEQRRGIRGRQETVGTYYYLHALRAVKPGEQSPKEHFQRVEWIRSLPRMELAKHEPSTFRIPAGKTSMAKKPLVLCKRVASRNTARHSRYSTAPHPGLSPGYVKYYILLHKFLPFLIYKQGDAWRCSQVISVHTAASFSQVWSSSGSKPLEIYQEQP